MQGRFRLSMSCVQAASEDPALHMADGNRFRRP